MSLKFFILALSELSKVSHMIFSSNPLLIPFQTVVDWQTLEVSNVLTPDSRQWFQQLGYHDETIDRFLLNPDKRILNKIQSVIDQQNAREQQPSHRIGKWTILPRDLTVKSGELSMYCIAF